MPDQPLALLRRLVELMKVLVGQLRELCLHVSMNRGGGSTGRGNMLKGAAVRKSSRGLQRELRRSGGKLKPKLCLPTCV